nr:small RNA 2'-O-methyltransferase-like isoform X4 [Cherax quadricarinatus]
MDPSSKKNIIHGTSVSENGETTLCENRMLRQKIEDGSNGTLCIYDDSIIFSPPLYCQRYVKVMEMIISVSKGVFTKVVDIGCAGLKFFRYLKNVPGIQEILLLDKDFHILKDNEYRIKPLPADFLILRKLPLNVKAVCGDGRKYDPLLSETQVVTMIELIEHMPLSELPDLIKCVFKDIRPKLVIITTPNADFNKFIPGYIPGSFRHFDHKFEWTAAQFYQWKVKREGQLELSPLVLLPWKTVLVRPRHTSSKTSK